MANGPMRLLLSYLKDDRGLIALALVLATTNQVFSLLDPLIFRYVIDNYATKFQGTPRASSSAVSRCSWPLRSVSHSSRGWPRTSRITSSA